MKSLLIATKNKGKINEIKLGLKSLENKGITILTLTDVRVEGSPVENGATFKDNALIKAKFYGHQTGLPVLTDDAGITIPYLNNEPGVKSRRWPGYEASDQELIDYTLHKLKDAKDHERTAYLTTCLCFYQPNSNQTVFVEESIKGNISNVPSKKFTPGYPYRALFVVDHLNKYYDELTESEHKKINHRLKALKKLVKIISKI